MKKGLIADLFYKFESACYFYNGPNHFADIRNMIEIDKGRQVEEPVKKLKSTNIILN